MVKQVNNKDFINVGDKINVYGFSNTQKIELNCISVGNFEIKYNATLYDNNKVINTGEAILYPDDYKIGIYFPDFKIQGDIVPAHLYMKDTSIGIVMGKAIYYLSKN